MKSGGVCQWRYNSTNCIRPPNILSRPDTNNFRITPCNALIPFDDILYLEIPDVDPEERAGFHTLGGLIFNIARQIPKTGETFYWNGVHFEIVDMDGNRIDKVLVRMGDEEDVDEK